MTPLLVLLAAGAAWCAPPGPFDGQRFHGRIAWSADGNHNDEDDWAASPLALAIFAAFGVEARLVHFDYNNILPATDPAWEKEHALSVLGAAERFGYDRSVFFDCQRDLEGAVRSLVRAINASTAEDPLWWVLAGPMQVPRMAIERSDPARRRFVYCISHSRWNDGFARSYTFPYNKRAVIPTGIHWVQIRDQNEFLATSPWGRPARPEEWVPWFWLRDAAGEKLRWLWDRLRTCPRADASDAGMAWFLMTGDEAAEISKLRALLVEGRRPRPLNPRPRVRLEAENFPVFEGFEIDDANRAASHQLCARLSGRAGRLLTRFEDPYAAHRAVYDAEIRYLAPEGGCRLELAVRGRRAGRPWQAEAGTVWQSHFVSGVAIAEEDEIALAVRCPEGRAVEIDYVELRLKP